jgi:hypothetical protein
MRFRIFVFCLVFSCCALGPPLAHSQQTTGNLITSTSTCSTTANASGGCVIGVVSSTSGQASITLNGPSNTFTATVQFEGSADGQVTWYPVGGCTLAGVCNVTSATAPGAWQFNVGALDHIRARASSFSSGPVQVGINATPTSARAITSGSSSFVASGDLSGSSTSQQVVGIKNNALPSLSTGYLNWNGSAWVFSSPGGSPGGSVGQLQGNNTTFGGIPNTLANFTTGQITDTVPDQGASPIAGFYTTTDSATSATDTSTNAFFNTGSSSRHNPLAVSIQNVAEFGVYWQPGPQGEIVIGNAVAAASINQSPFAKSVVMSNTAGHTEQRIYQNSASDTGTMQAFINQTAASSAWKAWSVCAGATGSDTGCGAGAIVAALDGAGDLTVTNPTTATSLANFNSPILAFASNYYSGSSSQNTWTAQQQCISGTNQPCNLVFAQSGSSGGGSLVMPSGATTGTGAGFYAYGQGSDPNLTTKGILNSAGWGGATTIATSYLVLLPSAVPPSGNDFLSVSGTADGNGNYAGSWLTGIPFNDVVSATGAIAAIANGNNPTTINCAQTTNTQSCLTIGETSAATGGSGNSGVTISTAANSTSTPLNISEGAISTVFPTAAVNISQGSNTGATNVPGLNIAATWNNASLVGTLINLAITNTSTGAGSSFISGQGGTGGATNEFLIDASGNYRTTGGNFEATAATISTSFCGGLCSGSSTASTGGALAQGSDNSNTGSGAKAGNGLFRAGMLTATSPNGAALEGAIQVGSGFLKGTAVANFGDVVCGTTTAFTVTDCSHTGPAVNIVGIANSTTNPIGVVASGQALVKLDGALTAIGDTVCMGTTTDGLAHDSGGVAACGTAGTSIGVIIADSGTITTMSGNSTAATAMSTTLVLVQLHLGK